MIGLINVKNRTVRILKSVNQIKRRPEFLSRHPESYEAICLQSMDGRIVGE